MQTGDFSVYVQKRMQQKDEAALKYVLADERGRWFVERLFERCHIETSTFGDTEKTNGMLIFEGERRVALDILRNIRFLGVEGMEKKQLAEKERMDFESITQEIYKEEYEEENGL